MSATDVAIAPEIAQVRTTPRGASRRPSLFALLLRIALAPRPASGARRLQTRGAASRAAAVIGSDMAITFAFSATFVALGLRIRPFPKPFQKRQQWLLPLSVLAAIACLGGVSTACSRAADPGRRRTSAGRAIGLSMLRSTRDWLPIAVLGTAYEHLAEFTREDHDEPIDRLLHAWDLRLFGCEPTRVVGRWHHPVLTDLLSVVYFTYFLHPLGIAILLAARKRRWALRQMISSTVTVMYTGFLLYCLFPAGPPRFFLKYSKPIPSAFGWARRIETSLDGMNTLIRRSSFPSLHCALATVGMLGAWEFRDEVRPRWLLPAAVTPLTFLLYFSTIYLRHHWGVDVILGIFVGAGGYHAGRILSARWPSFLRVAECRPTLAADPDRLSA